MENMPHRTGLDTTRSAVAFGEVTRSDWQQRMPVLRGERVVLRELRPSDATALCAMLNTEEVARFISPPPASVDDFERFIAWTERQRIAGTYVCFAVTLRGFDTAIGLFQVRQTAANFKTAEWGFALGSSFWGTGVFEEGADLVLDFVFETIGARRLEARAAVLNGRGTGALLKIGAVQECVLRKSFLRHGEYLDQALFAILKGDPRGSRAMPTIPVSRIH